MFIQSRIVSSDSHNIRTSSVPAAKHTLRWISIQGHPYWRQQKSRTNCCHNLQKCRHYFQNIL